MAMSDRIAVMDAGVIIQVGTPEDIYKQPKTRFVAQFVGHTNLFDGAVRKIADGCAVVDSQGILLTAASPERLEIGQHVTVALRYERLMLNAGATALTAPIVERMFLGGTVRVIVGLADGRRVTADIPATSSTDLPPIGSPVMLGFDAGDARILVD
jgi:putative spermidine/putrescine transport system ATP-binding protein